MSKLNTKIIVNPAAGANSSRKKWLRIQDVLKQCNFHFDYEYTDCTGHAIVLAREAATQGYNRIIAVGGDGTVNEVANGILNSSAAKDISLGIISTGTGSDFIRSIGIPRDFIKACSRVSSQVRVKIDIGIVEYQYKGNKVRRYFLNTAGFGLDAAVVEATQKIPKQLGGTIPYLLGLIKALVTYQNKQAKITSDGNVTEQRVVGVVVANGGYAGGGMHFAPTARLDDGLLDTLIINDMRKVELLSVFPRVYNGTHVKLAKVKMEKTTKISVESPDHALIYADGELLGEAPATFSILPAALKIVV